MRTDRRRLAVFSVETSRRRAPFFRGRRQQVRGKRGQKMGNMTQRVGLNDKKCATCRWWQSERDIQFWNKKPFKVECEAKGDCMAIKAPKFYSGTCSKWVPWEKLP